MIATSTDATPITNTSSEDDDALLDCLAAVLQDCRQQEDPIATTFLQQYTPLYDRRHAQRVSKDDFEVIKPLAKGQFASVSVVQSKADGGVYAMKILNKNHLLHEQERSFSMEERLILGHPDANHDWMPQLHCSFQDEDHLYLVMEYASGGDLYSVLDRKENLILTEDEARFYIAETIMAVDSLHQLGYVHRDIKPQNILIDATGHIKLADFGSAIRIDQCTKTPPAVAVGTCDYVSPEVLQAQEGQMTYGIEVDWWSVGIVLYEMLQELPPFYSDKSESETYLNILFHETKLHFNDALPMSPDCKDLIRRLLAKREVRLGKQGVQEIQAHPFFRGIDWTSLRQSNPPFRPVLASAEDTSHFSVTQPASELEFPPCDAIQPVQRELWRHLPFLGYYYDARQKSGTRKEQLETAEHEPSDIAMSSQAEQPPAVKEHLTHSSSCALSSNLTSGTERLGHRLSLSRTPSSSSSASTASSSSLSSSSAVPLTPPSPLKTSPHSHSSASPRGLQAQETFQERLRRQREARQRMSSQVDGMRRKLDAFAQLLENEQCRRDMEFLECASQVMATLDPLLSTYPKQKQETFSNKRIQPGVASILSTFSRKTDGL